jgi:hypothetical protein
MKQVLLNFEATMLSLMNSPHGFMQKPLGKYHFSLLKYEILKKVFVVFCLKMNEKECILRSLQWHILIILSTAVIYECS